MRAFEKCPRCEEYNFVPCECRCFELGRSWHGEAPECWQAYYGKNPELLVERWASEYDSNGDYTIVSGKEAEVWVRDEDGNVTKWDVTGEAEPVYYAHEKTDPQHSSAGAPHAD